MTVKLGIIGTGIAARELHLPALRKLRDKFEIVGVCNHTEEKAREFSKLVGDVPYFLNYQDLLSNSKVEAVDLVLPIELNFSVTREALEAGKHVIVEKPIASNIFDAELMTAFEDRYDRAMMVAENYRYNPVFKKAKEEIDNGKIGEPYAVFLDSFTAMDSRNQYGRTTWRLNHKYPGGYVTDGGIHLIAVLRDIFGEIKSGISFTRSVNPEIGKMDSMSFQYVFQTGVSGVLNIYYSVNGVTKSQLAVLGRNGTLVVENNSVIVKRDGNPDLVEKFETDGGFQSEFEDFYDAIVNGKKPVSTFFQAYKDFQTIVSALNSARKWEGLVLEG